MRRRGGLGRNYGRAPAGGVTVPVRPGRRDRRSQAVSGCRQVGRPVTRQLAVSPCPRGRRRHQQPKPAPGSRRRRPRHVHTKATLMDLEHLLTSREGFGLETATFLQRASCRIADGVDLADLVERASEFERRCLETAIGCTAAELPTGAPPVEVYDLNPIRTGKSLKMAALAVARSQTIDVSILKFGEEGPRITVLSTETDNANALRGHLGIINERPALARLKVGETADSVYMRHP